MLFFIGMAWGFGLEQADVDSALAQVRPAVEAETAHPLHAAPRVRRVTMQQLRRELEEEHRHRIATGDPGEIGDPSGALAAFVPWTGEIVVIEDAWTSTLDHLDVTPAEAHGLLGCLLAHELTHAIQDEAGVVGDDTTPDGLRAAETMIEGHATLVAGRVCRRVYGEEVADLHGAVSGDALLDASDRDDVATTYLHGQLYLALQEDLHGRDATWAALRAPPPVEEVERALAPILAARWHKPWELAAVDPWPGDSAGLRWGGRVTTRLLLAWLGMPNVYGTTASAPASRAGLASAYQGAAGAEWRVALWLESEAAAAAWVASLKAATPNGESVRVYLYPVTFWLKRPPGGALERRAPRTDPSFVDAWYVNGPVVIGVGALGPRASDPARVARDARTLAGTFVADPETDARLATMARLRAGTPPRPLPALPPE